MPVWERSVPTLSSLVAFEAAYRHRNFTRAATELNYSQATISRRIAILEGELGVPLFERGRHDVDPTAEADALVAAVRLALNDLATTCDGIRLRARDRTKLTIRSDVSLTSAVVNPTIGALRQKHPELDIRVLSSFEPIETDDEPFDIGLQYGRNRESGFVISPVADEEVFPVCSPTLAATLSDQFAVDDLRDLPLLHVDYGEPAWTDWRRFLSHVGADDVADLAGPVFSTYLVCLDLAERGEGVALGWGHTVQPRIDQGRLVRLTEFTMAIPDAVLAYRPTAAASEPVNDLLTMLRERLR